MKRDLDLIRLILLEVEKSPQSGNLLAIEIDGYTKKEIAYHIGLLNEAGYLKALSFPCHDFLDWMPSQLTWDGHEFLDLARDDPRWTKAKEKASQISALSLPIVIEILKQLVINSLK